MIVVDNGSVNDSRQVIAAFGKRVGSIYKNAGGQASAVNAVFREATGQLVLFDADDFLYPNACAMFVGDWRPEYSKVQCPLTCVDGEGRRLPCCLVGRRLESGEVWKNCCQLEPGTCPISGNAWRAEVLKKILPMPEGRFRITADDYLNSLAPFYGSVGVIQTPLGAYRLHASSHWSSHKHDKNRFYTAIRSRLHGKLTTNKLTVREAQARNLPMSDDLVMRDFTHLRLRLISLRGEKAHHPFPMDTCLTLLTKRCIAAIRDPFLSFARKTKALASFFVFILCPRALIRPLYFRLAKRRQ